MMPQAWITIILFVRRSGANIPNSLDWIYNAVSVTNAKLYLVTGSPLCSTSTISGTCTDKMEKVPGKELLSHRSGLSC